MVEICGQCFGKKVDGMGRRRSMLVDRWLDENERCDFVKWMYLISNEALVFAVDVDDFESMASLNEFFELGVWSTFGIDG